MTFVAEAHGQHRLQGQGQKCHGWKITTASSFLFCLHLPQMDLQEYYPNIRNLGFVNNFAHFAAEARITFVPNEVNATMVAGR